MGCPFLGGPVAHICGGKGSRKRDAANEGPSRSSVPTWRDRSRFVEPIGPVDVPAGPCLGIDLEYLSG